MVKNLPRGVTTVTLPYITDNTDNTDTTIQSSLDASDFLKSSETHPSLDGITLTVSTKAELTSVITEALNQNFTYMMFLNEYHGSIDEIFSKITTKYTLPLVLIFTKTLQAKPYFFVFTDRLNKYYPSYNDFLKNDNKNLITPESSTSTPSQLEHYESPIFSQHDKQVIHKFISKYISDMNVCDPAASILDCKTCKYRSSNSRHSDYSFCSTLEDIEVWTDDDIEKFINIVLSDKFHVRSCSDVYKDELQSILDSSKINSSLSSSQKESLQNIIEMIEEIIYEDKIDDSI